MDQRLTNRQPIGWLTEHTTRWVDNRVGYRLIWTKQADGDGTQHNEAAKTAHEM
jgi:hypothetical protein